LGHNITAFGIILKDSIQDAEQDITDGAPYSFTSGVTATSSRFSVIFKTASTVTGIEDSGENSGVAISKNTNGQIIIRCEKGIVGKGIVSVYNAVGQKLENQPLTSSTTVLSQSHASGVYVVNVIANGKATIRKVLIN